MDVIPNDSKCQLGDYYHQATELTTTPYERNVNFGRNNEFDLTAVSAFQDDHTHTVLVQ